MAGRQDDVIDRRTMSEGVLEAEKPETSKPASKLLEFLNIFCFSPGILMFFLLH